MRALELGRKTSTRVVALACAIAFNGINGIGGIGVIGASEGACPSVPAFVTPSPPAKRVRREWDGKWLTTYGKMTLESDGNRVTGAYFYGDASHPVVGQIRNGNVEGQRLGFAWDEIGGAGAGSGTFTLADDGQSFAGTWGYGADSEGGGLWTGTRE